MFNADLKPRAKSPLMTMPAAAKSSRPAAGTRVVQENELKLQEAIQQNEHLRSLYQQKVTERERLNFKYAKS